MLGSRAEEMLQMRAYGWSYRRIGATHGVTGNRVSQIMSEVRETLGVGTDAEAVAEATRRGLIEIGGEVERAFGG